MTSFKKKERLQLLVRIFGSIGLILWILHMIDWGKVLDVVRQGEMPYFIASFLAIQLTVLSSIWKWKLLVNSSLAKGERNDASVTKLGRFYYIGLFFNNFLPGSVGGDVIRVYYLGRITGVPAAAASVAFERLTSGMALIGIAAVSIFSIKTSKSVIRSVLIITLFSIFLLAIARKWLKKRHMEVNRIALENSSRVRKIIEIGKQSLVKAASTAAAYRKNSWDWWLAIASLSILFQAGMAWINQLLFLALGFDLPWLQLLMIITLISVITMLPVSINGLGVREGCYVFFFKELGVPSEVAVSVSLLFFFFVTVSSLLGGVFWMSERGRKDEVIRKQAD